MARVRKWMQLASDRTKQKGRQGALRRALGMKAGQKIPWNRLVTAAKKKGRLGQMARMAKQYFKANRNRMKKKKKRPFPTRGRYKNRMRPHGPMSRPVAARRSRYRGMTRGRPKPQAPKPS